MVARDRPWQRALRGHGLEGVDDAASGQRHIGLQSYTLATPLIDDRQHAERPARGELVMYDVHAPALMAPARRRYDTAGRLTRFL